MKLGRFDRIQSGTLNFSCFQELQYSFRITNCKDFRFTLRVLILLKQLAGLYFHIPFCNKRCTYCDFYFVTSGQLIERFVEAIQVEMEMVGKEYELLEPVTTIYFGGGTPSLLGVAHIRTLIEKIHAVYAVAVGAEITLELNPEDGTGPYLEAVASAGINRLSIGVQSFDDEKLVWMNRGHSSRDSEAVLEFAQRAGFENISADLIFGAPGQSVPQWEAELERMMRFGVPHLSVYSLTMEPRTPYWKQVQAGKIAEPPDTLLADCFHRANAYLAEKGYEHYEVSSYAIPGFRSKHNSAYWQHKNYLGFGPSAHSFWWADDRAHRWYNARNLGQYVEHLEAGKWPGMERELLARDQLANEYLMLRLRTKDGLDLRRFNDYYGIDLLQSRKKEVRLLLHDAYIEIRDDCLCLTDKGLVIADAITQKLLG